MKFTLTQIDIETNKKIATTELDMNITEKEMNEYSQLWCDCNYLKSNPDKQPKYVENYKGVSHGWICPKCKKFIQIG